ncbi:MAG TPA: putative metal-binding motif-containing protein [Polyangiales bacterium]
MTNRLAYAALFLAACGSNGGESSEGPLDNEDPTGQRDAGRSRADSSVSHGDDDSDASKPTNCRANDGADHDGDGFTRAQGDCDDCDSKINPGAYDFPTDNVDDDCSGAAATPKDAPCDANLAIDSTDPKDAARSLGLCKFVGETSKAWGVVSARYTDANGSGSIVDPLAAGLLSSFGAAKPKAGESLLALSSGVARAPDQPGYTASCDLFGSMCGGLFDPFNLRGCSGAGTPPPGYPKESSTCRSASSGGIFGGGTQIFNQAALELKVRVPNNVNSLSFDSIFYTSEYPKYVCNRYNDFYVVFKEPKPASVEDGNIVFDANDDPIGVNTGLLTVCDPSIQLSDTPKQFDCAAGTGLLKGTGYGDGEAMCEGAGDQGGASTGWLHTTAPVEGGQVITLRFAIWDTNDANLDSTVLIDNFQWSGDETDVGTIPIF